MNKAQFQQTLTSKTVPKSMMLYGESHFLIDYYTKQLAVLYAASEDALTLYFDNYTFTAAKEHLSQTSLFSTTSLLIIKHDKKIPKNELDILIEYTLKKEDTYFIYCYYGDDYKSSYLSFTKKNGADYVRFFRPFFNEARQILRTRADELQIDIDNDALNHLYALQNEELSLAYNELDKLAIFNKPITNKDIDQLAYALGEIKVDKLIVNLLKKQTFLNELETLLEQGENEIRIITALSSELCTLFLFHTHIKLYGNADSAQILGYKLPPSIEKERATLAMKLKLFTINQLLDQLIRTEFQLKNESFSDKKALLYSSLIKIQTLL